MRIRLEHGVPLVSLSITIEGQAVDLERVLLDTGSRGTLVSTDRLLEVGIRPDASDRIVSIRGVGGVEYVLQKRASVVRLGELAVYDTPVQVGAMDYGLDLDGIVGTDVLHATRAVIDMGALELRGPLAGTTSVDND